MRLALDIGGTLVKCACVTDDGDIAHAGEFPSDPALDTDRFSRHLLDATRSLISEWNCPIETVGAGMAGFTDGKNGIVHESPNLPGVKNLELARELRDGLGLPAYIDNDATVAAWGEFLFGEHREIRDLLVVTLGTGIGGGLVLDGRLHRGTRGMSGEIGQMTLIPDGPRCPGGGKGCLEHYVGKAGLMDDYRSRAGLTDAVDPRIIHDRAEARDHHALDAWKAYGSSLAVVLASAANLLDLGAIILTGGILGAWEHFNEPLSVTFREHLITPLKDRLTIDRSSLGGNAGLLGAAFLDKAL